MQIDLYCPIEVIDAELIGDDRRHVRAYLKLNNLSDHPVDGFIAKARWRDQRGNVAVSRVVAKRLRLRGRGSRGVAFSTGALPGARSVSLQFLYVRFADDQKDWIGDADRMVTVPNLPAPDGREMNRLTAVAGEDAVTFPYESARLWVCVCGRANPPRRGHCRRCGRAREFVLRECARHVVMARRYPSSARSRVRVELPLTEHAGRDEAMRARYRRYLKQRRMIARRSVTMLIIALLILLIAYLGQRAKPPVQTSIAPVRLVDVPTRSTRMSG